MSRSKENKSTSTSVSDGSITYVDVKHQGLLKDHIDILRNPDQHNWELVKQTRDMTVYRGEINGINAYIKQFHPQSLTGKIRKALGFKEALREMQFATLLNNAEIHTPRPMAAETGHNNWLVVRAIEHFMPADKWHIQQLQRGTEGRKNIKKANVALARMIGKMHSAGILHCDLHCENLLIRTDTDKPTPVLVGLHHLKHHKRLNRRQMARNLSQLYRDRVFFSTRSDQLRFLKQYLSFAPKIGLLWGWLYLIELFALRESDRQYRNEDSRIFATNSFFTKLKLKNGWHGHAILRSNHKPPGSLISDMEFTEADWLEIFKTPDLLDSTDDCEIVKNSSSGKVVRKTIAFGEKKLDVYIKHPKFKNRWKQFRSIFRRSRCKKAFKLGHELLSRNIPTAMPVAIIERRHNLMLQDSILITESIESDHLHAYMSKWFGEAPSSNKILDQKHKHRAYRKILTQLGKSIQRLHDNCYYHRDLKATNIRVNWNPNKQSLPNIYLIDLDGLCKVRFMTTKRRFKGLMRLNVSLLQCPPVNNSGRLRMLIGYIVRFGIMQTSFKPFWRQLEEWSGRKIHKQMRSLRQRQKAARNPK